MLTIGSTYSSCRPKRLTRLYLSILFAHRSSCSIVELGKCSDDYHDKANWLLPWHVSAFYKLHHATRPFEIFEGNAGMLRRRRERDENSTPRSEVSLLKFRSTTPSLRDSSYEIRPGYFMDARVPANEHNGIPLVPAAFSSETRFAFVAQKPRAVMGSLSLTCYVSSRFSNGSVARISTRPQVLLVPISITEPSGFP